MRKNWQLLCLTALCALLVLACGAWAGEKVLTVAYNEEPQTADGQMTTSCYMIPLNVYDRLLECATVGPGKSELVPGLAESWEISDDGKIYTFHIRKGVKFHSGEELTGKDVVYTFDRMLDPATKALNTDILDFVDGAAERMEGKADSTRGLELVDPYTVRITLKEPFVPFLSILASPQASILSEAFTRPLGDKYGLSPETTCGTGPFVLTEWVLNDHHTLAAFDDYWRGRSKLDRFVVKVVTDTETMRMLFESGEIDIFDCDFAISQIPYFLGHKAWKDQIVSGPRVGIYYFTFNQQIKPFDDVRVRKAFQMAVDRKKLLEKLYYDQGQLENGVMPAGLIHYNPGQTVIPYDPARAKALLAEAGYPDGVDLEIALIASASSQWQKMSEVVQAMVAPVGFRVTLVQMDEAAWYATRKEGKLPMYCQKWSADFNDPDNFFYTFFGSKGTVARSFNNISDEVFAALDRGRSELDFAKRGKLYADLEKTIVIDQAAWLPLFSLKHLYVTQPRVKTFVVPWNGWSDFSAYEMEVE
ncbi:MAG: ABC transporter substrate-binding protein [Synergistaceae bacterium]|nr:ABC transporter substrate-binding protein [Synergistaceae bacterium]